MLHDFVTHSFPNPPVLEMKHRASQLPFQLSSKAARSSKLGTVPPGCLLGVRFGCTHPARSPAAQQQHLPRATCHPCSPSEDAATPSAAFLTFFSPAGTQNLQVSNTTPFPHHNTHSHCLQSSGDAPGLAQAALCPISGPDSCSFLLWDHLEDTNILILTLQCPSAGKQPHCSKPHHQLHSHGHSKAQKTTRELLGRGEPRPPHCLHGVLG